MDTARGVACLLVAVICLSCAAAAAARSPAARLHRHLKRLNKPAVKSIEVRQPHLFPLAFRPAEVCVCSMPAVLLLLLPLSRFEFLAWGKMVFLQEIIHR
jgi:hypothetical protein